MLAVTLSVIAVFVPVAFMEGMIGRFFFQFGITVTVAVAISYAVSMTLTPMMSARILQGAPPRGRGRRGAGLLPGRREAPRGSSAPSATGWSAFFSGLEARYRRILTWALDHRRGTVLIAVGTMVVTMFLGRFVNSTFFPPQDMSTFQVNLEMPTGTPLAVAQAEAERLSLAIRRIPGVQNVFLQVGGGVDEAVNKAVAARQPRPAPGAQLQPGGREELDPGAREGVRRARTSPSPIPAWGFGSRTQPVQFSLRSDDWPALLEAVDASTRR